MFSKDEWTQQELYKYTKELALDGIKVVLVDTILKSLENVDTVRYNPHTLNDMPANTVFVFYCDTGKMTKERLPFYRSKLPNHKCVSLRGGRGYWRPNYSLNEKNESTPENAKK